MGRRTVGIMGTLSSPSPTAPTSRAHLPSSDLRRFSTDRHQEVFSSRCCTRCLCLRWSISFESPRRTESSAARRSRLGGTSSQRLQGQSSSYFPFYLPLSHTRTYITGISLGLAHRVKLVIPIPLKFESSDSSPLPTISSDAFDLDRHSFMLFTSGSTGQPKGVPITHAALASQCASMSEVWGWSSEDRILHVVSPTARSDLCGVKLMSIWLVLGMCMRGGYSFRCIISMVWSMCF